MQSITRFLREKWCLKVPLLLLVGIILLKVLSLIIFDIDAAKLIADEETGELLARREYVVYQTYDQSVGLEAMPDFLPETFQGEWVLVSYSMTSMALTNIAFTAPETRAESLQVVAALIQRVLTPEFRRFDILHWGEDPLDALGSQNAHIGYLGHLNIMLAAYHFLGGDNPEYKLLFTSISQHLQERMTASPFFNAQTYPGEIYVPDNAVVVASLALFDQRFPDQATGVADQWLTYMDENLRDPDTSLLPFRLSQDGRVTQPGRGSGSGWNTFFLFYADPDFARTQYGYLKQHMYKRTIFGITGVCEWSDCSGTGDVDSGPLFAGLSPSGTGFAIAGAKFTGDVKFLDQILYTAELGGTSWPTLHGRHYLVSPLVGDAILLAMMSVTEWNGRFFTDS